jgi:DNA-binding transcriptional ArsR family regulator
MKRDMDLIRLLLIANVTGEKPQELNQYDGRTVLYHYTLLQDAGFIEARFVEGNDVVPVAVNYVRVTWAGQEFYDASKENKLWEMAKQELMKQGASYTVTAVLAWLKYQLHVKLTGAPPDAD